MQIDGRQKFPRPRKAFCRNYYCNDSHCMYAHNIFDLAYCTNSNMKCDDSSCVNLVHNRKEKLALLDLICNGFLIVSIGNQRRCIYRLLEKILHYETLLGIITYEVAYKPSIGEKILMCNGLKCVGCHCNFAHNIYEINMCNCKLDDCRALIHNNEEFDLLFSILTGKIPGIMERIAEYFKYWEQL